MVEFPIDYKWSSYSMLIGRKEEKLINSEIILRHGNSLLQIFVDELERYAFIGKL